MTDLAIRNSEGDASIQLLCAEELEAVDGGARFFGAVVKVVDWVGRGLTVATIADATSTDMGSFGQYERNRAGGNYR